MVGEEEISVDCALTSCRMGPLLTGVGARVATTWNSWVLPTISCGREVPLLLPELEPPLELELELLELDPPGSKLTGSTLMPCTRET
jgi:hypothetical protein